MGGAIRLSLGRLDGQWENALFPPSAVERPAAAVHLGAHPPGRPPAADRRLAYPLGWWMLPVLVTLAPFYGGWLLFLCNNTQHVGLMDNVPDYRLCCWTARFHPVLSFLYWHMNYHTEHHMYAAVPCYNLNGCTGRSRTTCRPRRRGCGAHGARSARSCGASEEPGISHQPMVIGHERAAAGGQWFAKQAP